MTAPKGKMTPEQEIERIKMDYQEHWPKLERLPAIQNALADVNPVKLGEEAAKALYGNCCAPTKHEIDAGTETYENYLAFKRREQLIG